ncbi:hypothetical protein [Agriterribacter humi]|jgi:hypothetical protein|nr:hypothetical protein [Agriterribacter humi]
MNKSESIFGISFSIEEVKDMFKNTSSAIYELLSGESCIVVTPPLPPGT